MKTQIQEFLEKEYPGVNFSVFYPPDGFGDYSTNIAFLLGKERKENPGKIAEEVIDKLKEEFTVEFEKIEVANDGFINFYLSKDFLIKQLKKISADKKYGFNETMKGKTVMIEYTDPNPFKLFHIGHLMSNTIGEAMARLYEASGAKVIRVNYQGDVGLHVAKAILGMQILKEFKPNDEDTLSKKMEYLGWCYSLGSGSGFNFLVIGENINRFDQLIEERNKRVEDGDLDIINKAIYEKNNSEINKLYEWGMKISLEYFETIYKRLGTKFEHYFFESETGKDGLKIVQENKEKFKESEGATIFRGEDYGLHNRVFINSQGLPTYEAKELGVNKKKFDLYNLDLSIIVTGNEINDYFKVLLKVMELTMPKIAQRTKHIGHGMMRLPAGKMSSRTGEVITADSLIEEVKTRLPGSNAEIKESIAVGAIKYFILKHSPEHDIVFDFEKSVSVKGDAAPYLQYTHARLMGIKSKAGKIDKSDFTALEKDVELSVMKKLIKFSETVTAAAQANLSNTLTLYLYELCNLANKFYESSPVIQEENEKIRVARLALVDLTSQVLEKGLTLLGIKAPQRI